MNFFQLFKKLIDRKIPFIFLRLLLYIYRKQKCCVKWNNVKSSFFTVKNGVRQGAVVSPTFFCVYLDTLLQSLRNSGVGCYLGGTFMGAFSYADDVILIAPTRHSLQIMLKICEEFSSTHEMQFSTDPSPSKSKTKCLYFTKDDSQPEPERVTLDGNKLPWVDSAKHLGNLLSTCLLKNHSYPDTNKDLRIKKATFFDRVHSIKQEFGFCSKRILCELLRIYATSFYGSMIWNMQSEDYSKLIRSYNVAIKLLWELPHQAHKYFVEELTDGPHLQSMLHSRYIGFLRSLDCSHKAEVRLLYYVCRNNLLTVTGSNIKFLMNTYECKTSADMLNRKKMK